jgi:hypothetical protein
MYVKIEKDQHELHPSSVIKALVALVEEVGVSFLELGQPSFNLQKWNLYNINSISIQLDSE